MKTHLMLGVKTFAAMALAVVLGLVLGLFVSWKVGLMVGVVLALAAFVIGTTLITRNMLRIMRNPGSMLEEAADSLDSWLSPSAKAKQAAGQPITTLPSPAGGAPRNLGDADRETGHGSMFGEVPRPVSG